MAFCFQGQANAQNHLPRCLLPYPNPISLEQHSHSGSAVTTSTRRKRRFDSVSSTRSPRTMDSGNMADADEALSQYFGERRRPQHRVGASNTSTDDMSLYGLPPAGFPGMGMAGMSLDALEYMTDFERAFYEHHMNASTQPDYSQGLLRDPSVPDNTGNADYSMQNNEPRYTQPQDFRTQNSHFGGAFENENVPFTSLTSSSLNSQDIGDTTFQNAWNFYSQAENNRRLLSAQPTTVPGYTPIDPFAHLLPQTTQASQAIAQTSSTSAFPAQGQNPRGNGAAGPWVGLQSQSGNNAANLAQRRAAMVAPRRNRDALNATATGGNPNHNNLSATPTAQPSNTQGNNRRRVSRTTESGGQQQPQPLPLAGRPRQAVDHSRPATRLPRSPELEALFSPNAVRLTDLYSEEEIEAIRQHHASFTRDVRSFQQRRRRNQGIRALEPKGLDNMNDGRPPPKETEELTVNLECKACMSQLVDTVMLPCGHAVLCQWCADQHMPSSKVDPTRPRGEANCPMCRLPVKQKVRIYIN